MHNDFLPDVPADCNLLTKTYAELGHTLAFFLRIAHSQHLVVSYMYFNNVATPSQ